MANGATATLVVQYSDTSADGNVIIAEIDSEVHSSSSFFPGEAVYFRIYANCDYSIFLSDSGAFVSSSGNGSESASDDISFVQTKTANISYPYVSGWSFNWIGNNAYSTPEAPTINKQRINLSGVSENEETIVAMGKASYVTNYDQYCLTPGSSEDGYAVTILIKEDI